MCSIVWCPSVVQCLCDRLMAQLASIAWQLEMLSRCFLATCHARPWLQALLEETADQPVAGNQLVAVLRQLQGMMKRCAVLCCDLLCCAVLHWCLDVLCCAVLSQGSGFSCCGASRSAAPLPVRVGSTSPSIAGLLEYCNDSCLFLPALRRLEMVLPTGDGCLSRPCSLLPLLLPAHRRFEMVMPADDGYQEVASLLSWHEAEAADKWRGLPPKEFLEAHCKAHTVRCCTCLAVLRCGRLWVHMGWAARVWLCAEGWGCNACGCVAGCCWEAALHRSAGAAACMRSAADGTTPQEQSLPTSPHPPSQCPPHCSCPPPASTSLSATERRRAPTSAPPACCRTWGCS